MGTRDGRRPGGRRALICRRYLSAPHLLVAPQAPSGRRDKWSSPSSLPRWSSSHLRLRTTRSPAPGIPPLTFTTMALSQTAKIALAVSFFGVLAFVFGVVAENKKPASGTPVQGKGVVICQYPSDPTVLLGSLSIVTLLVSTVLGFVSVFCPYRGISVPTEVLFQRTNLLVFFTIAVGVTVLAEGMMIWATVTEGLHRSRNIHHNLENQCPTAKTGLFGGAAFLALDSALFWLICQMLALNARADYLEEDPKGDYGQVLTTDHDANGRGHGQRPRAPV